MTRDNCILTTKDFTILEIMLDRLAERDGPIGRLLRDKLDSAIVMLGDDIPPDVATLNTRLRFRVDDAVDTRVLSHAPMGSPVGMFLPITAPRGLGLLGLRENARMAVATAEGRTEELLLEKVLFQPEAERAERVSWDEAATPTARRAMMRVVGGSLAGGLPTLAQLGQGNPGGDDPGPSAA